MQFGDHVNAKFCLKNDWVHGLILITDIAIN